jgi:hypothetical protein
MAGTSPAMTTEKWFDATGTCSNGLEPPHPACFHLKKQATADLEAHAIGRPFPQRIRNDRIVGCCIGCVACGPATILPLAMRAVIPPQSLSSCAARMKLAHRGHQS